MEKEDVIKILELVLSCLKDSKKIGREEEGLREGPGEQTKRIDEWKPSPQATELARSKKVSVSKCADKFRNWAKGSGRKFNDLDARFEQFISYEKVSEGDSEIDYEPQINYRPSLAEFDRAVSLFRMNNSFWGHAMGPEPGMLGCKCPPEILLKHGIDPKTGLAK